MMPINAHHHNGFSFWADMLTYALKPDIGIVNHYYMQFNNQYFDDLLNLCKYRFKTDEVLFNVCNFSLELTGSDIQAPIDYNLLDYTEVLKNLPRSLLEEYNIFTMYDDKLRNRAFNKALEVLTSTIEFI